MSEMWWRSPMCDRRIGVYADWMKELRRYRCEGAYVIRSAATKQILHRSSSDSRLFRDLDRHMLGWEDPQVSRLRYFRMDEIEIAVEIERSLPRQKVA